MTKHEAERRRQQINALCDLGFTYHEAEALRRISMTLHRWHECECGTDSACLVRGHWDHDAGEFVYDDDGAPFWEYAGASGRSRYARTPDRERGAKVRLATIIDKVNAARRTHTTNGQLTPQEPLSYYIQTDPRGCALYILRPGDIPDGPAGAHVGSFYTRGVAVY